MDFLETAPLHERSRQRQGLRLARVPKAHLERLPEIEFGSLTP